MPTLRHQTDWSAIADVAPVGDGQSPGDGWVAHTASVAGVTDGKLVLTRQGGGDFFSQCVTRPDSEATPNPAIEADFDGGFPSGNPGGVVLRDPVTGNTYAANYDPDYTDIGIFRLVNGGFNYIDTGGVRHGVSAPPADHAYRLRLEKVGTALTLTITDLTAGTVWQTLTGTDDTAAMRVPLVGGVYIQGGARGFMRTATYENDGDLSYNSATPTSITLGFTPPAGTVTHTYLHRSATSGFTPAGTAGGVGTCVAADPTFPYTDAAPGYGPQHYKAVTVLTTGTLTSPQLTCGTALPPLQILGLGDSTMANGYPTTDPLAQMAVALRTMRGPREVTVVNRGEAYRQTVNFVSGASLLVDAKAAAATAFGDPDPVANPVHVVYCLGVNDAKVGTARSPADYRANVLSTIGDLLAAGYASVYLMQVTYVVPGTAGEWDEASDALIEQYNRVLASLVNGGTVRAGDTAAYQLAAQGALAMGDGVHPTSAGNVVRGQLWATAIVSPAGRGGSLSRPLARALARP